MKTMTITKNTSIVLIAVIAAVMMVGTLAVTVTDSAFAFVKQKASCDNSGSPSCNRVNSGDRPGHDACENAGPAANNPNCQ